MKGFKVAALSGVGHDDIKKNLIHMKFIDRITLKRFYNINVISMNPVIIEYTLKQKMLYTINKLMTVKPDAWETMYNQILEQFRKYLKTKEDKDYEIKRLD